MEESEKEVQEGGDVHITCKYTTSYSTYYLYWYRHDEANPPLFLIRRFSGISDERRADGLDTRFSMELKTRETSTTLTITGSQLKDSSTYYCALRVNTNPLINQFPPAVSIHQGESAFFECSLRDGNMGSYYMYWYRRRPRLSPEFIYREGDIYGDEFKERFFAKVESSDNKFSLQIKPSEIEDSGVYHCGARAL
ncbi:VPREB protein, partial [Polyodon spathula]|nr:VPREB protein [Polyodon spathula]